MVISHSDVPLSLQTRNKSHTCYVSKDFNCAMTLLSDRALKTLLVSTYESQVVMGKSGLSELNVHPRQLLGWCWCFSGTVKVPWASWPWLTERIHGQTFKIEAIIFLLTTFFFLWISLLKGKGDVFLVGLCLEQNLGWDRFWPCSPHPSCLWISLAIIHSVSLAWKEPRHQMHDPAQRALKVTYTEAEFVARDFYCLHLLSCTV